MKVTVCTMLLFFILLSGMWYVSFAQNSNITFAFRGGVGVSLLSYDNNVKSSTEGSGRSTGFSFNIGLTMNIQLNKRFAIQPELLYSSETAQNSETFERVNTSSTISGKANYTVRRTLTSINVPILFKRTIGESKAGQFSILAGPSIGVIISLKDQERIDPPIDKLPSVVDYDMNPSSQFQLGLLLGVEYRIHDDFFIDWRWNYSITGHLETPVYHASFSNLTIGVGCLF